MIGVNSKTGGVLSGQAHLVQSIRDILTTPKGSRVLRRDYGSNLPALVGRPQNDDTRMRIIAASADALSKWEPRIRAERIEPLAAGPDGHLALRLTYQHLEDSGQNTLEISL